MAKYDRRLLVPYLQDVYSVELLLVKLDKQRSSAWVNAWSYQSRIDQDPPPEKPERVSMWWLLHGVLFLLFGYLCFRHIASDWWILSWVYGFAAWFLFMLAKDGFYDFVNYQDDMYDYKNTLEAYNSRQAKRDGYKQNVATWNQQANTISRRYDEVIALKNKVYSANVIPMQYRNVYAMHYLYNYFSTSQADDVDMILQTFLLEEIKSKLDRIIDQQTELIIGQRAMMANQEKMNKTLAQNHEREMRQLANLNSNAERRNQYLEMINTNLAISNYYAYNDYVRR